jgi:signal recognition particle subunit SRP72
LVTFEKAYCEYKLNRIDDCLQTLSAIEQQGLRERELQAQALYRKELFNECYETYVDLIRNSSDDYEAERATNLIASIACMTLTGGTVGLSDLPEVTFEQHYNHACFWLNSQKSSEMPVLKLKQSEGIRTRCKLSLFTSLTKSLTNI